METPCTPARAAPSPSPEPTRPPFAAHRHTPSSSTSSSSTAAALAPTALAVPSSPTLPDTPTLTSPLPFAAPARPSPAHPAARKSVISVRRKPVPLGDGADDGRPALPRSASSGTLASLSTLAAPALARAMSTDTLASLAQSQPPVYVLAVDTPLAGNASADLAGPAPPAGPSAPPYSPHHTRESHPTFGVTAERELPEDLPTYTADNQTEPKTLARGLWRWGFACPPLWFIGMLIPAEAEADPEKAQKLEEMIAIIRVAELRYARRCAIAFACTCAMLVVLVVAIVLARTL